MGSAASLLVSFRRGTSGAAGVLVKGHIDECRDGVNEDELKEWLFGVLVCGRREMGWG